MDNWIITFLAILFIFIVLLCMMYVIPAFNKKQKDRIRDKNIKLIEFIFAAIGVLATCLTIISGSSNLINNNINNIIQEQNLINNNSVITNQQIINNMVNINDDTSETELMRMAEVCFDNKGWSTLLDIYSSDKLMDNAVRSANLAYLYVNGLGVSQNFMIAEQYYTLAIQKGCDDAIQKKLLIYLKCNMLEEAIDLIIKNSTREEIKNVILLLMEKQNNDNNKNISEIVKSFLELKYSDQIKLLSNTYFWETRSLKCGDYTLNYKLMERWKEKITYETLSVTYKLNHDSLRFSFTSTFVEKVYKTHTEGILNGDFIRINNVNDKLATDLS